MTSPLENLAPRFIEIAVVMLRMVSTELRAEYLRIECSSLGFDAPKPIRNRTPLEELRDIREFLQRRAPALLELADKELGP